MEDVSYVLDAAVGDFDTDMCLICRECYAESFLLVLRELITRGAQEKPDLVERFACASAVSQCILLDTAAYLTWSVPGELDDMKGVQHAGGVLELVINGVFISLERTQRRNSHPSAEVFSTLGQSVLVHGARPAWDQLHQAGRRMILPASGPRYR